MIRDLHKEYIAINENNRIVEDLIRKRKFDEILRCDDGRIYYYGDLSISVKKQKITSLPDNLTVYGCLNTNMKMVVMPKGLIVHDDFTCMKNHIKEVSPDLIVYGDFNCAHNKLTDIPISVKITGELYCAYNKIKRVADNLDVGGEIYAHSNDFNTTNTIHHSQIIVDDEYQVIQDRLTKINLIKSKYERKN